MIGVYKYFHELPFCIMDTIFKLKQNTDAW